MKYAMDSSDVAKYDQISLNESYEEIVNWDSTAFLHKPLTEEMHRYTYGIVPWHWHELLEYVYVEKGPVEIHVRKKMVQVYEGEGCFINSNEFHMLQPSESAKTTKMRTQVFSKTIISGPDDSVFDQKYMQPFVRSQGLEFYKISPDSAPARELLLCMNNAFEAGIELKPGYELDVRSYLCRAWKLLLGETWEIIQKNKSIEDNDANRIRKILLFIQQNYSSSIALKDVSQAANISERECFRCFRRNLGTTPMEYLQNYRINSATNMLINSNDTITDISAKCGFAQIGYFGKVFKSIIGISPTEYRKRSKMIE